MSVEHCRQCRLALDNHLYDASGDLEREYYRCEIDESFPDLFKGTRCPYTVGWLEALPPPERSCQKAIEGRACGVGEDNSSCSSCGSSCSALGCGGGNVPEVDPIAQYADRDAGYEVFCESCTQSRLEAIGAISS